MAALSRAIYKIVISILLHPFTINHIWNEVRHFLDSHKREFNLFCPMIDEGEVFIYEIID